MMVRGPWCSSPRWIGRTADDMHIGRIATGVAASGGGEVGQAAVVAHDGRDLDRQPREVGERERRQNSVGTCDLGEERFFTGASREHCALAESIGQRAETAPPNRLSAGGAR